MSKFLFYISILLLAGATSLAYFQERHLKESILNQESIIQEQHEAVTRTEKELQESKDAFSAQWSDQEKNKKELSHAQESLAKITDDLMQVQKELADRDRELAQLKNDFSIKTGRVEELEAAMQALSQNKETSKSKNSSDKAKIKHHEINNDSSKNEDPSKEPVSLESHTQAGKEINVVAVNTTWNFVVISIGNKDGMVAGTEISIKRHGQVIAKAKVTSVEVLTSAADLMKDSLASGITVEVGDQVVVVENKTAK